MEECTNLTLRTAREAAKLPRWKAAAAVGVSEGTIRDWERGDAMPGPDDVWHLERAYGADGLWHRWMRSTYDSYRDNWPEIVPRDLLAAMVNARHQMEDVLRIQDRMERDALDGKIDDPAAKAQYLSELQEAQDAITGIIFRLSAKEGL